MQVAMVVEPAEQVGDRVLFNTVHAFLGALEQLRERLRHVGRHARFFGTPASWAINAHRSDYLAIGEGDGSHGADPHPELIGRHDADVGCSPANTWVSSSSPTMTSPRWSAPPRSVRRRRR